MSNLRDEVRSIKTAKDILRRTFNVHGLKTIEYIQIPDLGFEGEMCKLSTNIFAYILSETPERTKLKKIKEFCYSPDLDFKEFLR